MDDTIGLSPTSTVEMSLGGLKLHAARVAWVLAAALVLSSFLVSLSARFNQLLAVSWLNRIGLAQLHLHYDFLRYYVSTLDAITFTIFFGLALLIFLSRPNNWMALFTSGMILFAGIALVRPLDALVGVPQAARIPLLVSISAGFVLVQLFLLLFPDGQVRPAWLTIPAILWPMWSLVWYLFIPLSQQPLPWPPRSEPVAASILWALTGLTAQVFRYRTLSTPEEQRKSRWVIWGLLLAGTGFILFISIPLLFESVNQPGSDRLLYVIGGVPLLYASTAAIPISLTIATLRYRLWDVDLILNRTVLYIAVTSVLAGLYAAVIKVMQTVFVSVTGNESDVAIVLTTIVVVAVFTPVKDAAQKLVDRRLKKSNDPAKDLLAFDQQIKSVLEVMDPRQVTFRLLDNAASVLGAKGGAIFLSTAGQPEMLHTCGNWEDDPVVKVPLKLNEEELGWIALGPPLRGSRYTETEMELVRQCANRVAQAIAFFGSLH